MPTASYSTLIAHVRVKRPGGSGWVGVLNLVGACGSLASTATIWKSLGPAGRKGQIGEAYFPTVFFHVFSITYNESQ